MAIPHPSSKKEKGRRLLPLPLSSWEVQEFLGRSVHQTFDVNGKGVTMTHGPFLLEGGWGSGHGLCTSDPRKWMSVVMITTHPSSRRKEERRL